MSKSSKMEAFTYWLTLPFYLMLLPFALAALPRAPKQKIKHKKHTK